MRDRLFIFEIFTRVARTRSFSVAGRELGISQPTASRMIAALEREVGVALVTRSTRAVTLTTAGEDYLARVEAILAAVDDADTSARGAKEARGTLRVAAPFSIAARDMIPRLPKFLARNPGVRVDMLMDDARSDLVKEGIDVAIRVGPLSGSSATARRIGEVPRLVAASPAYLARAGTPASPSELAKHSILVGPMSSGAAAWTFHRGNRTTIARVEPRFKASANEGVVAAAVAGMGILSTGLWGCREELARGALVRILEEWTLDPAEVHALLPAGRAAKGAARAFVEYLVAEMT